MNGGTQTEHKSTAVATDTEMLFSWKSVDVEPKSSPTSFWLQLAEKVGSRKFNLGF